MILINILNLFYLIKVFVYFLVFRRRNDQRHISGSSGNGVDTTLAAFDIIVPMFNEEKVIINTINALRSIDYPNFNIIVVDDGSTDSSLKLIEKRFKNLENLKVISQPNRGKAMALNYGIANSSGNFIISVDADTIVLPDVIHKLLPYFDNGQVAAVAGNIRVGNKNNLITNIQYTEYITNPNYERSIFDPFNGILVIPGAIGAFRREILSELGGYLADTLTEDTELTMRILNNGYSVRNAPDVFGFTEAPESFKMFFKQRLRWKAGTFQVLRKYRHEAFGNSNKIFSLLIIPYSWLFGLLIPIFTPMADFVFFYQIIWLGNFTIVPYYLLLILVDLITCIVILFKNNEKTDIVTVLFQRFVLRQLIMVVYLNIFIRISTGKLFVWEKNIRRGTVNINKMI